MSEKLDAGPNEPMRSPEPAEDGRDSKHIRGWRLYFLMLGLWISLFLSTLETTIVSTALVSITNALNGFERRDWVVTSYLLTYTAFLMVFAKLSDIFGRKSMMMLALVLFTAFSLACGAVNSIEALIILRAFQGLGASGIYSMIMVIAPTLIPQEKQGKYIGIVSSVFVIASVLGPILGGAISTHSTWRWVFLLNVPGGATGLLLVAMFLPSSTHDVRLRQMLRAKFSKESLKRIDVLGIILLLAASVLLVFALEQGGTRYSWKSAVIIAILVLACLCWVAFVVWEYIVGVSKSAQEAIFPLRLLKDRILVASIMTAFLIGFPFVVVVINIPQRAQAVYNMSPVDAGLTLLPLLLCSPLAMTVGGALTSKFKIPPFYLIFLGGVLQLVGVALTSVLPSSKERITSQQYGYEAIMGVGFGLNLSTLLTLAPLIVSEQDLPVTMGALTQVRVLGGTIGLAIAATVLNNHLRSNVLSILTPTQLKEISNALSYINTLSKEQQLVVRTAFAEGYNKQMQIMTAFSGAAVLASMWIWERKLRVVGSSTTSQ